MLAAATPTKFPAAFASGAGGGYIRPIPQASQIAITPGAASLTDGFPPVNFQALASGGVPPSGLDMNGILKQITAGIQWLQAGGLPVYDAAFATAIGGYPAGAVLVKADGSAFWRSSVDGNATNPDTGGAGWVSFGITTALAWAAITGRPTALSAFTNDVGFTGGLVLNAVGYVYLQSIPSGPSLGTEGTIVAIAGRPGTWMICGEVNSASNMWDLLRRVA